MPLVYKKKLRGLIIPLGVTDDQCKQHISGGETAAGHPVEHQQYINVYQEIPTNACTANVSPPKVCEK